MAFAHQLQLSSCGVEESSRKFGLVSTFCLLRKSMEQDRMSAGSNDSADSTAAYWVEWFQALKGNEFYCDVDEEYILDRFNLTGLNIEVQNYSLALDMITDALEEDLNEEQRLEVEKCARHLYGLIHARFILTTRGLGKMQDKFRHSEFGRCPRALCENQSVLPVGLSDVPGSRCVKLYCPRCEDVYNPISRRHLAVDGAHFGTTFPHLFLQAYPNTVQNRSLKRYVPKIFGFKVHHIANEHRKQDQLREQQQQRITQVAQNET
ncbi:casein kinase II, regulatory subunit [Phlyctochytrium arcticum]|nr:casein kinase II, regulatory subunit [Phlyctochytrium arcticum]